MNREEKLIDVLYLFCTEEKAMKGREILENIKTIIREHDNKLIAEMEELKQDENDSNPLTGLTNIRINNFISKCQDLWEA